MDGGFFGELLEIVIDLNYGRRRHDADARQVHLWTYVCAGSDMDGSPYGMEDMMGEDDMEYGQEQDPYGMEGEMDGSGQYGQEEGQEYGEEMVSYKNANTLAG